MYLFFIPNSRQNMSRSVQLTILKHLCRERLPVHCWPLNECYVVQGVCLLICGGLSVFMSKFGSDVWASATASNPSRRIGRAPWLQFCRVEDGIFLISVVNNINSIQLRSHLKNCCRKCVCKVSKSFRFNRFTNCHCKYLAIYHQARCFSQCHWWLYTNILTQDT